MFDRILVPTDGGAVSELAVPYSVELADRFDATLFPMYVIDTDALSYALGSEQVDRLDAGGFGEMTELHERAANAIERVRVQVGDAPIDIDPVIEAGVPHNEIVAFAEANDIDLIVMTSQGRGGVKRALLGSVTERVARNTSMPVMVVDASDDPQELVETEAEAA